MIGYEHFLRREKTDREDIKTVQFGWPLGMPLVVISVATSGKYAQGWIPELRERCSRLKAAP